MSISAAIAAAAARTKRTRSTAGSRIRVANSFLCPFFFGEGDPFAFLHLPDERSPRFRWRIEGELIGQLAFSKFEIDREELVIQLAVAEGGITCAENIDPVADVTLSVAVEADKNERFIFRLRIGRAVMEF